MYKQTKYSGMNITPCNCNNNNNTGTDIEFSFYLAYYLLGPKYIQQRIQKKPSSSCCCCYDTLNENRLTFYWRSTSSSSSSSSVSSSVRSNNIDNKYTLHHHHHHHVQCKYIDITIEVECIKNSTNIKDKASVAFTSKITLGTFWYIIIQQQHDQNHKEYYVYTISPKQQQSHDQNSTSSHCDTSFLPTIYNHLSTQLQIDVSCTKPKLLASTFASALLSLSLPINQKLHNPTTIINRSLTSCYYDNNSSENGYTDHVNDQFYIFDVKLHYIDFQKVDALLVNVQVPLRKSSNELVGNAGSVVPTDITNNDINISNDMNDYFILPCIIGQRMDFHLEQQIQLQYQNDSDSTKVLNTNTSTTINSTGYTEEDELVLWTSFQNWMEAIRQRCLDSLQSATSNLYAETNTCTDNHNMEQDTNSDGVMPPSIPILQQHLVSDNDNNRNISDHDNSSQLPLNTDDATSNDTKDTNSNGAKDATETEAISKTTTATTTASNNATSTNKRKRIIIKGGSGGGSGMNQKRYTNVVAQQRNNKR